MLLKNMLCKMLYFKKLSFPNKAFYLMFYIRTEILKKKKNLYYLLINLSIILNIVQGQQLLI